MEQPGRTCPQCSQAISLGDTTVSAGGRLSHWSCRHPRALNADERALLFSYCLNHLVARCQACAHHVHLSHWLQTLTAGSGALSAVGISLTAFAHTSTAAQCSQRRYEAGRWRPARQLETSSSGANNSTTTRTC
jgi:hypothetical protein